MIYGLRVPNRLDTVKFNEKPLCRTLVGKISKLCKLITKYTIAVPNFDRIIIEI